MGRLQIKLALLLAITMSLLVGCDTVNKRELITTETVKTDVSETGDSGTKSELAGSGIYGTVIENPDIVVGDKMFSTQINDWFLNWGQYENKTVEIEGFQLLNSPYTFIARYSSVACPTCPQGYSAFEYDWKGEDLGILPEKQWLKITGTLKTGFEMVGNEQSMYYYLDVSSIEVMDKWGVDTVNN